MPAGETPLSGTEEILVDMGIMADKNPEAFAAALHILIQEGRVNAQQVLALCGATNLSTDYMPIKMMSDKELFNRFCQCVRKHALPIIDTECARGMDISVRVIQGIRKGNSVNTKSRDSIITYLRSTQGASVARCLTVLYAKV